MTVESLAAPGMIRVSVGNDYNNARVERHEFRDFAALGEYIRAQQPHGGHTGPYLCAPMQDEHRNAEAAQPTTTLAVDFDRLAPEAPKRLCEVIAKAGWRALLWTTRRHTPAAPRLRILCELDRPVDKPEYAAVYRALVRHLSAATGLVLEADPLCAKPEQPAVLPQPGSTLWARTEGATLTVDALLAFDPGAAQRAPGAPTNGACVEGQRNDSLFRLGCKLRRDGLEPPEIAAALIARNAAHCQPPLDAAEVERIAANAGRYTPAVAKHEDTPDEAIGVSDDELAARFTARHRDALRYVPEWGRWLKWDGTRWAHDTRREVFDMAREVCRAAMRALLEKADTEPKRQRIRERLGSKATVWNVVAMAGTDPAHAVTVEQLDADPWALNTPGGTIDLQSGLMRSHDPAELHTKCTAATPGGECPEFSSFLERVLPDASVRDYVQRLAGYALTGSTRERNLPFAYGTGQNGKGTLWHTIRAALGDYGLEIPAETLMESHNDRHPTELAVLRGARLVIGSEVDTGRRWNESRLKRLTGGDPISARFIARDQFEFEPTHTLVIVGNHKPGLRTVDEAIRSRIHLIPFMVTIPEAERDKDLPERLRAECGGILAWALAGCLDWQASGLRAPEAVTRATEGYLSAEDSIGQWLDECTARRGQVTLKAAHASYREWCESNGGQSPLGRNTFADQLEDRGFPRAEYGHANVMTFQGLQLASADGVFRDGN